MNNPYALAGEKYKTVWSTRKAVPSYEGPCMRVRRSSDNAEKDIFFIGNELDTASILSFCGSANGYAVIWYDQAYQDLRRNMMKFSSPDLNVGTYRYWVNNSSSSSTFSAGAAPDGSNTAVRQNFTSFSSGTAIIYSTWFTVDANTDYTFSIYAKAGTSSQCVLRIFNSNQTATIKEEVKDLTGDWVRYSITFNTGVYQYIVCAIRNGYVNSGNMFLWGPQLELGSVMTDYETTEFKSKSGFDLAGYGTAPPMICNAGVINTVNGKPAIYLNGTNSYFLYFQYFGQFCRSDYYLRPIDPGSDDQNSWSTYMVAKPTRLSHPAIQCMYGSDYNQSSAVRIGTFANFDASNVPYCVAFGNGGTFLGSAAAASAVTGNNQIFSSYRTKVLMTQYLNGVPGTSLVTTSSTEQSGYYGIGCRIRAAGNTEYWQGHVQEVVHYCGNLQAQRTDFESAARTYYSI